MANRDDKTVRTSGYLLTNFSIVCLSDVRAIAHLAFPVQRKNCQRLPFGLSGDPIKEMGREPHSKLSLLAHKLGTIILGVERRLFVGSDGNTST